jgi:LPS O-antigen subunit length determinant protein (WzzB/FepE family)
MEARIEQLEAMIADYENKYHNQNRSPWMDETNEYYENKAELDALNEELEQYYYDDSAELNREFESEWINYSNDDV